MIKHRRRSDAECSISGDRHIWGQYTVFVSKRLSHLFIEYTAPIMPMIELDD